MKQGIIALCFIDGSTSCYDVSCDFNRVRLMSLLSSPDKLNHIIGGKVFAYPNDAETFFRSLYRLPGRYTVQADRETIKEAIKKDTVRRWMSIPYPHMNRGAITVQKAAPLGECAFAQLQNRGAVTVQRLRP